VRYQVPFGRELREVISGGLEYDPFEKGFGLWRSWEWS